MSKLQEYDIEVRSLKAIKGQGLCKFITRIDAVNLLTKVVAIAQGYQNDWYKNLVACLKIGKFTIMMSSKEKRPLKTKENSYVLVSRILFRRNYDGVILRCLPIKKNHDIL